MSLTSNRHARKLSTRWPDGEAGRSEHQPVPEPETPTPTRRPSLREDQLNNGSVGSSKFPNIKHVFISTDGPDNYKVLA